MAEMIEESTGIESTTVGVYRTAATVKGGRRFSFSSLVVVGDRAGQVGFGYGKADQVPPAIEKAQKEARRRMKRYPLVGNTLPHAVEGRFGACSVRLLPASPGTGVIAGAAVRAVLEMLGVQDCLTKSSGSNNGKNLVKAVVDGLDQLRSKQLVQELRGVEVGKTTVEESIERGEAFLERSHAQAGGESKNGEAKAASSSKVEKSKSAPKSDVKKEPKSEKPAEEEPAAEKTEAAPEETPAEETKSD